MFSKFGRRRAQNVLVSAALVVGASVLASPVGAAGNGVPPAGAGNGGPPPQAVLNVNDTNAVGVVGDGFLSLDEAIKVANGSLSSSALSATERAQIQGTPGAGSRDLIKMVPGLTATVSSGQSVSPLVGNDNDTLDGTGASLVAAVPLVPGSVGLVVSSSNFTLTGLTVDKFETDMKVDFGGRELRNITLQSLQLRGSTFFGSLLTAAAFSSNGSLKGLSVTDSTFDAGAPAGNLIYIGSAVGPGGGSISNTLIQDVVFARNQVKNGAIGIYIHGTLSGANTDNATTRNVTVADNTFTGQTDSPINLAGGLPAIGATATNVTLDNIVVTRNNIQAANWGIWMGHETFGFFQGVSTTQNNLISHISVTDNTIAMGPAGNAQCVTLETAPEFPGEVATGNTIEHVTIAKNHISGCKNAEGSGGGITTDAARGGILSTATNNHMSDIKIMQNDIRDSDRGVVADGARAGNSGGSGGGTATGNVFQGLLIVGNSLTNNTTGIRLTGGDGAATTTVTGNSLTGVNIQANTITGSTTPCEAIVNAGIASGNTLDAKCPA
jgi:hypothetical protein